MRTDAPVRNLKGAGPRTAEAFAQKEIFTLGDLLRFYPSGYDFFAEEEKVAQTEDGSPCVLCLRITGPGSIVRRGGRIIVNLEGSDGTGKVRLIFFNMSYVRQTLRPGESFIFRGILRLQKNGTPAMVQPWFCPASEYGKLRGTLQPLYPSVHGVGPGRMRTLLHAALEETGEQEDALPLIYRERYALAEIHDAFRGMHFPKDRDDLQRARRRLIFDEFFRFMIAILREKKEREGEQTGRPMQGAGDWCGRFLDALGFSLTEEQTEACAQIREDLTGTGIMNRLVQGDVGSGKTAVAFYALILCAENRRQAALMAPTEVLARQHMESLRNILEKSGLPVHPVLLTGSVRGKARKEAMKAISDGSADIIIGTHALFQENAEYHDLGLVVTDEQHRFGVRQRTALVSKGQDVPVLVMSATPIPRTLAFLLYGELQVSSLRSLPPGRTPIKSLALRDSERGRAYRFLLGEIRSGRQCYVICPAVEEGLMQDLQNVKDYVEKIRSVLPDRIRIDAMTGRMRSEEKNRVMERFAAGETDILVSTTVIEVGINVPNATVILIENAERFGLSQLHQLRGRVGRGKEQSYCIFLYTGKEKPKRLEILEKNTSGFAIAEQDLKVRGPGDLFGIRQSGMPQFKLADLYEDADILQEAAECARTILRDTPDFRLEQEQKIDYASI